MKRSSGWTSREHGLNLLALGAFMLTALVFIFLLCFGTSQILR